MHAGVSAADRDSGAVPARANGDADLPGPPDGGYPPPPPRAGGNARETKEERLERMRRDEIREDRWDNRALAGSRYDGSNPSVSASSVDDMLMAFACMLPIFSCHLTNPCATSLLSPCT